jgi:hypothetical protein
MLLGYVCEDDTSETGFMAENEGEELYGVTHWMPLPAAPKGE